MLPRLDRLSLKPTGEFYALTPDEAAEEGEDPIYGHAFLPGQTKESLAATFRVRSKDPRPGTTNQYVYHFFEAEPLWQWVKRQDHAHNPKNRESLWKEDWLALHDRFDPAGPVPDWVSRLPQLDPAFSDPRANAPVAAPAPDPEWTKDVIDAYNISWNFAQNQHYGHPMENQLTELRETLHTIRQKYDDDFEGNDYRDPLMTYDNEGITLGGHIDIRDLIINLCDIVIVRTAPFRAKTLAIGFVAHFLSPPTFELRVANCVRDEEGVNVDQLRNGLDRHLTSIAQAVPTMQPLHRHLTRLNALRVRHHTFWNKQILNMHLKGPPPSAKTTAPMLTGYADALMILLKDKVEAATSVMSNFTHNRDDVEGFFQLEEYAHSSVRVYATVGTELLDEIRDLFRKIHTYTEEDDGRQRALTITLFANVLNLFVELSMWDDADYGLFGDMWGSDVQGWANTVASTLRSVMRYEDSVSTRSDPVTTFFWWYVAPLYEAGTVSNHISETRLAYGPPHLDRDDVLKALDLLNDTIERLPADPPVAHERPAGEATPGRRRQRTEEE
jgi:hypothetical protein